MYRRYTYIYKKGNAIEMNYYSQNYDFKLILTNYKYVFVLYNCRYFQFIIGY